MKLNFLKLIRTFLSFAGIAVYLSMFGSFICSLYNISLESDTAQNWFAGIIIFPSLVLATWLDAKIDDEQEASRDQHE